MTDEIDPKILELLGDPSLVQALDRPDLEEIRVEQREDGDDYVTAREQLHEALSKSITALNQMMTIAWQSQHPRSYEVLNQMIKTHSEMTRELLELQQRDLKVKREKNAPVQDGTGPRSITHNNTLVLSSAEMIDMVKQKLLK